MKRVKISIAVGEGEDGSGVDEFVFRDSRQFRLLWFDKLGFAHVCGKLPWKLIEVPLREWARAWAESHAEDLGATVRQCVADVTDGEIMSVLQNLDNQEVKLHVAEKDKRDIAVASHMVRELLRAISITFSRAANRIMTVWEFPQSNSDKNVSNSVLDWLFRKGGNNG